VDQQSPQQKLQAKVTTMFKGNTNPEFSIKKQGAGYNVVVTYTPYNKFRYISEEADKRSFESSLYNYIKNIYSTGVNTNFVTIKAVQKSQKLVANPKGQLHLISQSNDTVIREIAVANITKEEFDVLKETYEDPQYKMNEYITYHPFFLVELKLKTQKTGIKNLIVGEVTDEELSEPITEIRYEPTNVKTLGDRSSDKLEFEENFANIIRYSFEAGPTITSIRLIAQTDIIDTRSGENESTIDVYEATREEFEEIMDNWDNYRYKIFEQMDYTPIFLLDLISESRIEKLEFGPTTTIEGFYEKDYAKMTKTVDTLEADAIESLYTIFDYYPDTDEIIIRYKTKLPAEDDSESADGVHQIVHNAMMLTISRGNAFAVNREKLNNKQILYNFNPIWNQKMILKNIEANIGSEYGSKGIEQKYFRSITMPSDSEVIIEVDSCDFSDDYFRKKGDETCGDECVEDRIEKLGNRTMYKIHPPFLEEITFKVTSVFLDQAGQEETEDMGEMVFTKDDETNYWLQTSDDVEWYDLEDDLDLDPDTICQK